MIFQIYNEGTHLKGVDDSVSSTTTSGSINGLCEDDSSDEIPMRVPRHAIILPPSLVQDTYAGGPPFQVPDMLYYLMQLKTFNK